MPRAVIVGAGFAGLWTARTLAASSLEVVIVDRNNYHTFLPLLYQVAASELEPEQIAYPVRGIFRGCPNVGFVMAEVRGVDYGRRLLITDGMPVPYDYLLLAPGSVTRFFGVEGAQEHSFGLKTIEEGITLRNHILVCFERALNEGDEAVRRRLLTFVVVGGGPTGVEYAGALAELIRGPLARDFTGRVVPEARVVLLEASDSILRPFPERLRRYARARLERVGVHVETSAQVARILPDAVHLRDSTVLPAETVIWTAGVKGTPLHSSWGLETTSDGRVLTLDTLQAPGRPEVFVAGDLARPGMDAPLPMIAPVAIQQGRHAAMNILRLVAGQPPKPFAYLDKGTMATIGRGAAVTMFRGMGFTGLPAWLLWLFVHLLYLVGFRNRLIVLLNWSVDYFLFERAVRLIMPRCLLKADTRPRECEEPCDRVEERGP